MPRMILLNGPPSCGKSTLARRYAQEHPLSLDLDVDRIRDLIGGWQDEPHAAGLLARAVALAAARTHLEAGHDVIIPQFLARAEFVEQIEQLAADVDAEFHEIVLWVGVVRSSSELPGICQEVVRDMGGSRPAAPIQRTCPAPPVHGHVRREHSHHLGHGLFDIPAVHRTHIEQLPDLASARRTVCHPLIGRTAPYAACADTVPPPCGRTLASLASRLWVPRSSRWHQRVNPVPGKSLARRRAQLPNPRRAGYGTGLRSRRGLGSLSRGSSSLLTSSPARRARIACPVSNVTNGDLLADDRLHCGHPVDNLVVRDREPAVADRVG
jgi:hypothetical protein